jgi:membrane protease YdiL (CAAX protease family)
VDSPENAPDSVPPVIEPVLKPSFWQSRRPLPTWVVALCFLLGIGAIAYRTSLFYSHDALHRLQYPAETAARTAQGIIEFEAGALNLPAPQVIAMMTGYNASENTNEAIRICKSVLNARPALYTARNDDLALRVVLATILGEAKRTNELAELLTESEASHTESRAPALLRQIYLGITTNALRVTNDLSESEVPQGWASDVLRSHFARISGNKPAEQAASNAIVSRGTQSQTTGLVLFAIIMTATVSGGVVIFPAMRGRWRSLRAPSESSFVSWAATDALAVIMLGEFLGIPLYFVIDAANFPEFAFIRMYLYILISAAPFVILAALLLFHRNGLRVWSLFQWNRRTVLCGALALFALEFGGNIFLMRAIDLVGWEMDWAEGIVEDLLHGSPAAKSAVLVNMAVLGPLYEELQMRGVLFGSLRSRMPVPAAAALSACLFAFLHFYSPFGFASVWWFGFAAALVYERTRSLLACFVGHALTNIVLGLQHLVL